MLLVSCSIPAMRGCAQAPSRNPYEPPDSRQGNHVDGGVIRDRLGKVAIRGDKRCPKRVSQRDVYGVIGREVMTQLPRMLDEVERRVAGDRQQRKVAERVAGPVGI